MPDHVGKRPVATEGMDATTRAMDPSPGKRTLVEQAYVAGVQQRAEVRRAPDQGHDDDVHAAAARGVASPASKLPYADQIAASFGPRHDVGSIQAHVGGAAGEASAAMGATAYATGNHTVFAGAPDLHTAAHEAAHVVQQRGGVQLKGGVGQAGDEHERHADAVADRVVAGQSAAPLLDAYTGAGHAAAAPVQASAIQMKAEPTIKKGAKGAPVKKLQQRLNAKAVVEPPLKIDGDFGPLTDAAVREFQRGHVDSEGQQLDDDGIVGPLTWGALDIEHATAEIENTPEAVGEHVAKEMNRNNEDPHEADRGVHYDFNYKASFPDKWKDDYSSGFADPQYFDRLDYMDWRLKPGKSASAGVRAWLHGLTIAECFTAIIAIQSDAVRAAIGDQSFDAKFGSTDAAVPEAKRLRIHQKVEGTVVEGIDTQTDEAAKGDGGTFGNRPVKQGDWCYFFNHPKYLLKHPGGAFQGENSVFMGTDAGVQIWSGMGVSKASEREMMLAMVDAYNSPRDEWDDKELARIKAGNGGALPSQYDESSGEFPLQLNDFQEILDAPAFKIGDTTRKGGFVADSPSRLDTNKIEALR